MLTELEIGQFQAFGYVVLRECLDSDEVQRLQEAFDRVVKTAPALDDFGTAGSKRTLSFMEADDSFGALIEHPKIMEAMRDIDGTEFLYTGAGDLTANVDDVFWHTDGNPSMQPMLGKTAIYLSDATDGDGALNIIPGSHHPEFSAALFRSYSPLGDEYRGRAHDERFRGEVPGVVEVRAKPGDVVLWDNRIWHSAWKRKDGKPRRNIFFNYVRDPLDDPIRGREVREWVDKEVEAHEHRFVYTKKMMAKGGPAREKMAARLEELGIGNVRER